MAHVVLRFRSAPALAVVVLLLVGPASAFAAHAPSGSGSSSSNGYDISYPQCGSPYPSGQFGVVGVNGGLANDANGCLASELSWALSSPGLVSPAQPSASLYINTADPGPAPGVADWPASGTSAAYGTCTPGGWTTACAYVYGEQRAAYSYGLAYNANQAVAENDPWWLDIETTNSWATSTTPGYAQLNIAAIQGFIQGLRSPNQVPGATTSYAAGAGAAIGVYSTAAQWSQITGLGPTTTTNAFGALLPDWVAGARSLKQARSNCSASFTGARVTLSQAATTYDADVRCP